jgi:hypothetical protein
MTDEGGVEVPPLFVDIIREKIMICLVIIIITIIRRSDRFESSIIIRSVRLSNVERGQRLDGWSPELIQDLTSRFVIRAFQGIVITWSMINDVSAFFSEDNNLRT